MYLLMPLRFSLTEVETLLATAQSCIPSEGAQPGSFLVPYPTFSFVFPRPSGTSVSLVGLLSGQQIPGHRDAPIPGIRYHLPIQTNAGCWSFHGAAWQHLIVGQLYQMNPTEIHGAVNWGASLRLHLIIDVASDDALSA